MNSLSSRLGSSPCRDGAWMTSLSDASAGHEVVPIDEMLGSSPASTC